MNSRPMPRPQPKPVPPVAVPMVPEPEPIPPMETRPLPPEEGIPLPVIPAKPPQTPGPCDFLTTPAYDPNCIPQETEIKNVKLAHAYVPFQRFCSMELPIASLIHGTVFPELMQTYHKETASTLPDL